MNRREALRTAAGTASAVLSPATAAADRQPFRAQGTAVSGGPLDRIEIVVNSQIVRTRKAENRKAAGGGFERRRP